VDECLGSAPGATVSIGSCSTDVPNVTFQNGCRISDFIASCENPANPPGAFQSCAENVLNQLRWNNIITGTQQGKLSSCVAREKR
jgi:hypothetical protein